MLRRAAVPLTWGSDLSGTGASERYGPGWVVALRLNHHFDSAKNAGPRGLRTSLIFLLGAWFCDDKESGA